MATIATLSQSIDHFRQGVSIRTFLQVYNSAQPKLYGGNPTIVVPSGSRTPSETIFNDSQAGVGAERLERPGYDVIVNHEMGEYNFGQLSVAEATVPYFVDQNATTSGSVEFMLYQGVTASLPETLRYKSIVSLGQTDGVIEIFPIRKVIDFTAIDSDRDPNIKGSISYMETDEDSSRIRQYVVMDGGNIVPFLESDLYMSGVIRFQSQSNTVATTSSYSPIFSDSTRTEGQYDTVFSSAGIGYYTYDDDIKKYIFEMTGTEIDPPFPRYARPSTGGYSYAISHVTGWNMGTDSLAFGGLKK